MFIYDNIFFISDGTTQHAVFQCDFEDTICGFSSPESSPYVWKRTSWKPFGPNRAHPQGTFYMAEDSLIKVNYHFISVLL